MPRQERPRGIDDLIPVLTRATDAYARQCHPGEPWAAYLRRTLSGDDWGKLRRFVGYKNCSGEKSL